MLKQAAILFATLLAVINITACVEDTATTATTTETEETKKAALIKATKAAIVLDSYTEDTNTRNPAHKGSKNGNDEGP